MALETVRGYLADEDGSNKVYLETDLGQSWPETPRPTMERRGSSHEMVPGFDGSNVLPGHTVHQDFGVHVSSGKLELFVPYATDVLEDLETKYLASAPVLYSPDDGDNEWLLKWAPGDSFVIIPLEGYPNQFSLRMKFRVVSKTA